jgi:hypothetical protein
MNNVGRNFFPIVSEGFTPVLSGDKVQLSPTFEVPASSLKGAIYIAPNAGSASTFTATIGGTYVAGDTIVLTVVSNDVSSQVWRKTYNYTVVAGDTNTTIATNIYEKIYTDGLANDCPYVATNPSAGVVRVTAKSDNKRALVPTGFKTSTSGTLTVSAVSTTISEGYPADLIDKGVPAENINLASYDTVRIDYEPTEAVSSIDSETVVAKEIYLYLTVGNGSACALLINSL